MNKFMHPRNIYKTPPDFKQLAIDYEDFRSISKIVNLIHFSSFLITLLTLLIIFRT